MCHHGWVIPVIALLGQGRGARFAVLQHRLAIARTTLSRALNAATRLDLLMRNPGYGHPLRPEYLLTPRGETVAPACGDVVEAAASLEPPELGRRKWTLPMLAALETGGSRWSHLQERLPGCSPRALAQSLDELHAAGWVLREVLDERPPRPSYGLAGAAQPLARAAAGLAEVAR